MKNRSVLITISLLITIILFSSTQHRVQAASCNWTGGDVDWNDAAHWDCGHVPGSNDDATINGYITVTLTGNADVGSLTLSNGTLNLSAGSTVSTVILNIVCPQNI